MQKGKKCFQILGPFKVYPNSRLIIREDQIGVKVCIVVKRWGNIILNHLD